jgi:hypothetical protein
MMTMGKLGKRRASNRRKQTRSEFKDLSNKFDTLCGDVTTTKVSPEEMEKLFS